MPEVHLSSSFHALFLLAAFCTACGSSFWMYRRTVPPVPRKIRYLFLVLRAAAFFLILLLLADPMLSFITKKTRSPQIAVLVDRSQSMTIADRQGKRKETLRTLLHLPFWSEVKKFADLRYVTFAEKARDVPDFNVDSLSFDGEATDISGALRFVKLHSAENNFQAVVLLSDGIATTGESPLYDADELAVPIFTVGIGDTAEQKDLFIKNARTNEIVYAGTKIPVDVTVHSSGFKNERAEILLKDEKGIVIDRRMQLLGAGSQEYSVPLSFIPEQEGMHKYSVEVPMLPGELTGQNNRFTFFVRALKSKLNIVLIAGSPSADAACVRRALEQDRNSFRRSIYRAPGWNIRWRGMFCPCPVRRRLHRSCRISNRSDKSVHHAGTDSCFMRFGKASFFYRCPHHGLCTAPCLRYCSAVFLQRYSSWRISGFCLGV